MTRSEQPAFSVNLFETADGGFAVRIHEAAHLDLGQRTTYAAAIAGTLIRHVRDTYPGVLWPAFTESLGTPPDGPADLALLRVHP